MLRIKVWTAAKARAWHWKRPTSAFVPPVKTRRKVPLPSSKSARPNFRAREVMAVHCESKRINMASENIFSGLKVVDLASFIAGPSAAVILSDFGADVIKVEPPNGELWRHAR